MEIVLTENNFYLPLRIMDPFSIFVGNLPTCLTYREIKDTFYRFQRVLPPISLKKEYFLIITFTNEATMRTVLQHKDSITLKGQRVTFQQAYKKFEPRHIHLPFSFLLPLDILFPPPLPIPLHQLPPPLSPALPLPPPQSYVHPFPEGFSLFYYK